MIVQANLHGAVSIVNAIATGKGATLGIGLNVRAEAEATPGTGFSIESGRRGISSRLIERSVRKILPKGDLDRFRIRVRIHSEIPAGYGLKSSSAISSAVALATAGITGRKVRDSQVLLAGVEASLETGVSITGAYDDACACYYGGFTVTDNLSRKILRSEKGPPDVNAVIFVPKGRRRGNPKRLVTFKPAFEGAWSLAKRGEYWKAMTINGMAASPVLGPDTGLISDLLKAGALAASVSGNGPAVAAIVKKDNVRRVEAVLASQEGRILTTKINNVKADVHEL